MVKEKNRSEFTEERYGRRVDQDKVEKKRR